jgi:hypothetical protein
MEYGKEIRGMKPAYHGYDIMKENLKKQAT